jgi:hypothetical protein
MSRQVIQQQLDGLAMLREVVELVKNPKLVIEAHEAARKEVALTEEETAMVNAARENIKISAKISSDLQEKQVMINSAREQNEKMAQDLAAREAVVSAKEKELDARDVQSVQVNKRLLATQKEIMATKDALDVRVRENEKETARLQEMNNSLNIRLEKIKLREKAADL